MTDSRYYTTPSGTYKSVYFVLIFFCRSLLVFPIRYVHAVGKKQHNIINTKRFNDIQTIYTYFYINHPLTVQLEEIKYTSYHAMLFVDVHWCLINKLIQQSWLLNAASLSHKNWKWRRFPFKVKAVPQCWNLLHLQFVPHFPFFSSWLGNTFFPSNRWLPGGHWPVWRRLT